MRILTIITALLIAIMASSCGGSNKPQDVAEAPPATISEQSPTASPAESTKEPTATTPPSPTPTSAPTATPTPEPTPTPTPQPKDIEVIAKGFGQNDKELGLAFLIKNNQAEQAFKRTKYQVSIYDDAGELIGTVSHSIDFISPGETLGIGRKVYLEEGVAADIDVQLVKGRPVPAQDIPLDIVNGTYFPGENFDLATGILKNSGDAPLRDINIFVVAYNEAGEIVGGGADYVNFVPANSQTGVISFIAGNDIKTVEIYPAITGFTFMERETPADANAITLVDYGFAQDGRRFVSALLVENPNEKFAVENTAIQATAYSKDGIVLGVGKGHVDLLLPGQRLGVSRPIMIVDADNIDVAQLDVQLMSGAFVETEPLPYFTAEDIRYVQKSIFSDVTAQLINPYGKKFENVLVTAILYNEAGEIIGGGFDYVDVVAADGKTPVEISVKSRGEPATIEVYASVSALSKLE